MPRISHHMLNWITVGAALVGQWTLDSSPRFAIALLGVALAAALMDGWWYLVPIQSRWWYPALIGLIGFSMWQQPRGWFLIAWCAIEIGTGLRASSIIKRFERAIEMERARAERLAALGYMADTAAEPSQVQDDAPVTPEPPVPLWRYPIALVMGLVAVWFGAWCARVFFHLTGWQLDLLSVGIGYLAAKAVVAGAGDRSNLALRLLSATLAGFGVLFSRYLLLRWVFFDRLNTPSSVTGVISLALEDPGRWIGLWTMLFLALGVVAGWRYAEVSSRNRG